MNDELIIPIDDITKKFIAEHRHDDVHQLSLQANRYHGVNMALAVRQITGRQKIQNKVPYFYQAEDILYPVRLSLEQSSSEITARYKASLCEGKDFVDLTGGFGIDCYFISGKFDKTTYIEKQLELCQLARHNFNVLNAKNISVVNAKAEEYINQIKSADCIYLDPARRNDSGKKLMLLSDCEPDVRKIIHQLPEKANNIMIKLSPMLDISSAIQELPDVSEVHIISIENDCKEILFILQPKANKSIIIHTINFRAKADNQIFDYLLNNEPGATVKYTSELKKYLYEPNAAVMKSGAFKSVAQEFNIEKLHINTHLYTSDHYIPDFPGRIFEIIYNWGNSKKGWKLRTDKITKANISVRNYPVSVNDLRKKLKLFDGGDCYLFACTLANNDKTIIQCKKIDNKVK